MAGRALSIRAAMTAYVQILLLVCGLVMSGTGSYANDLPPIKPVAAIDLPRFMGKWHVIASIPTRFEKNAYNAVETYRLQPDGEVDTSFRFREGAFDNPVKTIHSTGYVKDGTGNAVWGVQVFWPIKAQYVVAYLKDDYSQTIVARDARDYTWIMARTPTIPQADYDALVLRVLDLGYPRSGIRKVPQAWPETGP
jgi:apolipoprotein D and lipocalin family protein